MVAHKSDSDWSVQHHFFWTSRHQMKILWRKNPSFLWCANRPFILSMLTFISPYGRLSPQDKKNPELHYLYIIWIIWLTGVLCSFIWSDLCQIFAIVSHMYQIFFIWQADRNKHIRNASEHLKKWTQNLIEIIELSQPEKVAYLLHFSLKMITKFSNCIMWFAKYRRCTHFVAWN